MTDFSRPHLKRLILRDFRCFKRLTWEPQDGLNFLIGPNARGKTSILEGACMLLRMKSPRSTHLSEMTHFGQAAFCLEGEFAGRHLKYQATLQEDSSKKNLQHSLTIDDVSDQKKKDYLAIGRIVWFGSDDLIMVYGGPERRRKFIDSAGLQLSSDYSHTLRFYERALRSRNLLLREGAPRKEIEAYNSPLAQSGDQLIAARTLLIQELLPYIATAGSFIAQENIECVYQPGATKNMLEALRSSQSDEMRLRTTQVGPHRDDFLITINGLPAGPFASEGQRRTIALALKMALAQLLDKKTGTPPLLLLDDIFGELDQQRRSALLAGIPLNSQALLTTTQLENITLPKGATIFELSSMDISY